MCRLINLPQNQLLSNPLAKDPLKQRFKDYNILLENPPKAYETSMLDQLDHYEQQSLKHKTLNRYKA